MRLASPWALLVLLLVPAALWLRRWRQQRASLRFSSARNAARAGRSLRQRLLATPLVLRVLALALLALALARPQKGTERVRDTSKGVAIMMVVDRSSSMGHDMEYEGEQLTRLDVVKRVFEEFVAGGSRGLAGRPSDLIGMVAFARYADTICPLTLAHGALARFLESVRLVTQRPEDGTAVGDALALAAARLKTADETLAKQLGERDKTYEIKSKIIILLTDGEHNAGKRTPEEAAKLAKQWGIKLYTIGVGGESIATIQTLFGPRKVRSGPGFDPSRLKALADLTGGIARTADDAASLRAIYAEIDRLEKSEVESVRYLDYRELFTPFALLALGLLFVETGLACTVFRRIP